MAHEATARTVPNTFPSTRPPDWAALRAALRLLRVTNPVELHLVRHGETAPNRDRVVTGSMDVDLSDAGREQAKALSQDLEMEYSLVVSSTMRRAQATAELALASRGARVDAMHLDWRLNERALGEYEGREARHIREYAMGDLDWSPPGGEPYREVARRTLWFLLDVALWASQRPARRVLVSTHSGPLRMLVGTLDRMEDPRAVLALNFPNASVTRRTFEGLELPQFLGPR